MNFTQFNKNGGVEGFCLIKTVDRKMTAKGVPYLDLTLADPDGEINAKLWDYKEELHGEFAANDLIKVRGTIQPFNDSQQLRIERIRKVTEADGVRIEDFVPSAGFSGEAMFNELMKVAGNFKDEELKTLVTALLNEYKDRLLYWPAAFRLHHAIRGGLLYHTLSILRMAQGVANIYPFIDSDLLFAGVILHDIAKTEEFDVAQTGIASGYTTDGNLIGHLVRGAMAVDRCGRKLGISENTLMLVEHMIISHHGEPEFGAAVRPVCAESELLSYIDMIDSRMEIYREVLGATPLDFAYSIHTEVGNHCVGGRIGGKNVPIRQELESGQTVEIITQNNQTPKAEWVSIARSSHAKAKIRAAVRELTAHESALGKEMLERKMKNRKVEWDEALVNQLIRKAGFKESLDFFKAISDNRLETNRLLDLYAELGRREQGTAERAAVRSAEEFNMESELGTKAKGEEDELVIGRDLKGLDFQLARCCNPVYGDDVFGFVTVSGGIKIHRVGCPNAPALRERFGYRIVKARWAGKGQGSYPITLHVVGHDDLGIVNSITSIISKEEHIMLRSINIDSHDGLFSGILTVMVDDTQRLTALIKKLRTVKGVKAVSRS